MPIGILGAARMGQMLARFAVDAGRDVVISNSRGPDGASFVHLAESDTRFDMNGDGIADKTAWSEQGDALRSLLSIATAMGRSTISMKSRSCMQYLEPVLRCPDEMIAMMKYCVTTAAAGYWPSPELKPLSD